MDKKISCAAAVIAVSSMICQAVPVLAAGTITNAAELDSAHAAGGEYVLAGDLEVANSGMNNSVTTGEIDGKGFTVTKKNEKLGDAMLYQNNESSWTYKNFIFDGNGQNVTFSDACMWYMAGNITFENVVFRNFKGSSGERFTLTNAGADMVLKDVVFEGNANTSQTVFDDNPGLNIIWNESTTKLEGATKVNISYEAGEIDVSALSDGCDVVIAASSEDKYNKAAALESPDGVIKTCDDASMTVSFISEPKPVEAAVEKRDDGSVKVTVDINELDSEWKKADVYAAAYADDSLRALKKTDITDDGQSVVFELESTDADTVSVYVWDSENMKPLSDAVDIDLNAPTPPPTDKPTASPTAAPPKPTEEAEDVIFGYDLDTDADIVEPMLSDGASIESDAGIDGAGLVFDGKSGYMTLPSDILTSEVTFMAWVKTNEIKSWSRLFDFGTDQSNNFFYSPSGGRVESVVNGKYDTMNVTAFSNIGVWEHYAVTRTDNKVQLYRNGELISEASCNNSVASLLQKSNYIGKSHYASDALFSGVMDNIYLYSRVCTQEEIKAEYDKYAESLNNENAYRDHSALEIPEQISGGYTLPSEGGYGSGISWSCEDDSVINDDLSVNVPNAGEADKNVRLTAVITNGSAEYTKDFDVVLLASAALVDLDDYPMSAVELTDDYLINATDKMDAYLNEFDIDRLTTNLYKTAGINNGAQGYGGWEGDLISGHTVGHYLSAVSQAANRGNEELAEKARQLVSAMRGAQIKEDGTVTATNNQNEEKVFDVKKGFLFASVKVASWADSAGEPIYGETQFDNVENNKTSIIEQAWVPWYTMHKLLAGLIDAYKLTGNEEALTTADELGTWVYNRVKDYDTEMVSSTQTMQDRVLNIEYGGMNDCMYELYKITGNPEHAKAAHMFDEITLFDSLYRGEDILANKHANTTIPKIIGALNRYRANEATNGQLAIDAPDNEHDMDYYLTVAENFWDMVVNDHSYITGGNSENEHFRAPHTEDSYRNNINCETCNTYNMLKLTRELYKITGDKKYIDYYENTYLNAIVSSQNPETGMTMYFQPMGTGYFKVFSTKWNSFWCCTGSGMESMTKLSDSIYYNKDNTIAVNQYISSILIDEDNHIRLTQDSEIPDGDNTTISVEPIAGESQHAAIALRIPDWTAGDPIVSVNGEAVDEKISAGYMIIERDWSAGDKISLTLPMEIRAYGLKDSETATAFKYGPVVLSVGMGTDGINSTSSVGMNVTVPTALDSVNEYVIIDPDYGTREKWLEELSENMVKTDGKLEFTMKNTDRELVFTPHYKRYDERYGIYWYITGMSEAEQQEQILKDKEDGRNRNIIIDSIEPSHDQQENGHGYKQENSTGVQGTADMTNYREIKSGGYVDYQMKVSSEKKNYVSVTYDPSDSGKKMNIYAGGVCIAEVTAPEDGGTIRYEIPQNVVERAYIAGADAATITGSEALHIVFRAECGTDAPKLCGSVKIVTDYGTDASLDALEISGGTLAPEFDPDVTEYDLTPADGADHVMISVSPSNKYGLVYINGKLINDTAEQSVELSEESMVITCKAEDHTTEKIYTIHLK